MSIQSILQSGVLAAVLTTSVLGQSTEVVSVAFGGGPPNGGTVVDLVSISGDGRYVAFPSTATDLVLGGTTGTQIFVRDRLLGTTDLVSVSMGGSSSSGIGRAPRISADGRYVLFNSNAFDLVSGDVNGATDLFVRDRTTGTTVQANRSASSVPADQNQDAHLFTHSISADGRFVAFPSPATNLVTGDTNGLVDVFLKSLQSGAVDRVSVGSGGVQANGNSTGRTAVSGDGRYVVFMSDATNLVAGDTNGVADVFLRDRQGGGATSLVSVSTGGAKGDDQSIPGSISADGRYVVFHSLATNLVPGDTNGTWDVFVRDRQLGTTERVSTDSCGGEGAGLSLSHQAISNDGRFVSFSSNAANIAPDDTNSSRDVFVKDRLLGITTRASLTSGGGQGSAGAAIPSPPAISADGLHVAFISDSSLVPGFAGPVVYVRNRGDTWSFTRFCLPGQDGILTCPCGNPPTESGRGCNNFGVGPVESSRLGASGISSLTNDTVVLNVDGENNFSFNVFWQGSGPPNATGFAHGAGVRCVSVALRRLYTGAANAGLISRPGMGDLSVHDRTAATGSPIACGETRYYFNIYRDPSAAGPCGSTSSTINLTNAVAITWGQ